MYQNKFVVAIKHAGKILREIGDVVKLPFGSEFTVLVKNLNSRRAKFILHIDGQDVLDGTEIIVNANSEVEMKRFIRAGNMNEGNAFKFIERTQAIEDGPRGIKIDDGVVRVEFWFEQAPPTPTVYHHYNDWDYRHPYRESLWKWPPHRPFYGATSSAPDNLSSVSLDVKTEDIMRCGSSAGSIAQASNASFSANSVTLNAAYNTSTTDNIRSMADVTVTNDVGITIPGSKVEQKFHTVYGFNAGAQSYAIAIRLTGRAGAINIVAPVTVKTTNICSTCSHTNKHNAKFCSQCGTALELV